MSTKHVDPFPSTRAFLLPRVSNTATKACLAQRRVYTHHTTTKSHIASPTSRARTTSGLSLDSPSMRAALTTVAAVPRAQPAALYHFTQHGTPRTPTRPSFSRLLTLPLLLRATPRLSSPNPRVSAVLPVAARTVSNSCDGRTGGRAIGERLPCVDTAPH